MTKKITLIAFLLNLCCTTLCAQNTPCNATEVNFLPNPCDTINAFNLPVVSTATVTPNNNTPCAGVTNDVWIKFTVPPYPSAGVRFKMISQSPQVSYALYTSPTNSCTNLTYIKCAEVKDETLFDDRQNGRFNFYFPDITVGQTYWVRLWESEPQTQGMILKTGVVVRNDNCAYAADLEGISCNYGADGLAEPETWTPRALSRSCQDGNDNWGTNDNAIWYKFSVTATTPQPITIRSFNVACSEGQATLQMAIWTNNAPYGCNLDQQSLVD
ncbi:MAG: hypothetical protein EAZ66_07175, partial [Alphaproteobacteria bacterium]